ncbi:MAG: ADOP family duplicated permease [Bryobacteraceae bacterium]
MEPLASLWQDLRVAMRLLAKSPGATALSVLSMALGIGLTAGIFSVVDAALLRPIAVERPAELVNVISRADDGQLFDSYGWPDYQDMAQAGDGLMSLVAFQRRATMLGGAEENSFPLTSPVTPNYFVVLGLRAELGVASVEAAEGRPQAVLGHQLWLKRFGGDPHVVGKTVLLNKHAFLVAGVMPAQFTGLTRGVVTDIWLSTDAWFTVFDRREQQSRNGQFYLVARLKPGVSAPHAAAVLDAAIRGEGKHKPAPAGATGTILESKYAFKWAANLIFGGGLLLILGAILFVACANVAQLRLAQAETRRKELGVRIALGASGWRVTRQLLVETAVLSVAGAGLGLGVADIFMKKVAQFISAAEVHVDFGIALNTRVLLYAVAALLLSVILAGLAPARHALRLNISEVLKSEQGAAGMRGGWQRRVLIVGQVAVSVALAGCAVLFVSSLRNAAAVRPGLDPHKNLLVLAVAQDWRGTAATWAEPACERLAALPGVRGVTYARRLPLSGSGGGWSVRVEAAGQPPLDVLANNVGGNYFKLMGTRVMAGRGIEPGDREGSPPVAVVSQTLARQMLPGRNPLGQWISVNAKQRQVVGIAEDAPSNSLHEEPSPYLFLPYAQMPLGDVTFMVETAGEPALLERAARQELKRFDPRSLVYDASTLRRQMDQALSWDSMMASVASGMGAFGVLLTAAGLFGVVQYSVNRRTRELGLRMALGARPGEIQRMILGESLRMAAWGVPFGLGLLGLAARSARTMVLGVSPLDPRIYAISAAAVTALTVVAAWLPARRATRVDPMVALRCD